METFSAPGETLTLTAPAGGVVSGQPYLIGSLLVIAMETAAEAASFQAQTKGVYSGTKPLNEVWTAVAPIYWDDSERKFTTDSDSAANKLVGVSTAAAAAAVVATSSVIGSPGDLVLSADTIEVVDYTGIAGATITLTVATDNGGSFVRTLTEGVDFTAAMSNTATAASLAAAISNLSGVSGVHTLTLASSTVGSPADLTIVGNVITIGAFAELAGVTVTVTVNGTATVLTEGVDWLISAGSPESDEETAISLGAAIEAITGVEAVVATDTITVVSVIVQATSDNPVPGHVRLDGVAR